MAAFGAGGALETVVEGETGVSFREQTVDALCEAVLRLDGAGIRPEACRARAEAFDLPRFRTEIRAAVEAM